MNYNQMLQNEVSDYTRQGAYYERVAGDTSSFRYPHLHAVSKNFKYDKALKAFMLSNEAKNTIEAISINEITFYEMMVREAKRLHLYDFFGYKATDQEKWEAYKSVCNAFKKNQERGKWNTNYQIYVIKPVDIPIRREFSALKDFIKKSQNCPIYFCKFRDVDLMFQFGSTLKGTNLVFVDDSKANLAQELFHAIYHLEEGIPGINDDNMHIEESWANVDALYAKQLTQGRMSRRVRKNHSPHDIKFLDYIFLRAYIGQAFLPEGECEFFHSAYALIEPTMKLLVNALGTDVNERNRQIIDGICYDKTDEIKAAFNSKYGTGAYERIFYDFDLFHRMTTVKEIAVEKKIPFEKIEQIMFGEDNLLPTVLDNELVKVIWENEDLNKNKEVIINLIEDFSEEARRRKFKITKLKWMEHVEKMCKGKSIQFKKEVN